jgi:hypothetical protein
MVGVLQSDRRASKLVVVTSAPNPKFAHVVLQERLRTSGSKGVLES